MSPEAQEINDRAAEWAARKDSGTLTREECAELEAWLATDIRHFGAYAKAQAVNARLNQMRKISVLRPVSLMAPAKADWSRRRLVLTGTVAASVAAAIFFAFWKNEEGPTFRTKVGQTREIVLSDGSDVTLNTDTELSVRFYNNLRMVRLLRGEAQFAVAKDKSRPFVVHAGDTEVRAVGTSFTVSMLPARPVQVLVKEGVVELSHVNVADSAFVRVKAKTRVIAPLDAPITTAAVTQIDLERDLAWQHGLIAFENTTLQHAAEEFSRYSEVRVVVGSSVANRTVTGLFAANDPVGFAKTAASLLKLKLAVETREVRIFEGPEQSP